MLNEAWAAAGAPSLAPYVRLWLDLAAAASRGIEPHRTVAGAIADSFHGWVAERLDAPEAARAAEAARLFATVKGLLVLDAVGRRATAKAALTTA